MSKKRTITVEALREQINRFLALPNTSEDARQTLCVLLGSVLHETGNYRGFGYVDWSAGGCDRWRAAGSPEEPSVKQTFLGPEYKRHYY